MQPAKPAIVLLALSLALAGAPHAAPESAGAARADHGSVEPDGDRDKEPGAREPECTRGT